MLEVYCRIAQLADQYGLSSEVDELDSRMVRVSQVMPAGLTAQQYIQDIYVRIYNLSAQIQQMQQAQSQSSNAQPKVNMSQPSINMDMNPAPFNVTSNNPIALDIEQ